LKQVHEQILEATIVATVTRADGTVEELGVIDSFKREDLSPAQERVAANRER
jgi:hypothetical protein